MVPRMRLLLVEDDPTMQSTLHRALTRRGMEVTAVGDGRAALGQWAAHQPDAVVLDLTLPGLDGLQVLQQARTRGLRTPVLILTARGTVGDRVMGLNAGADDYLPKPFDLDELEARLRALVRRSADPAASASLAPSTVQIGAIRHDKDTGALYLRGEQLSGRWWRHAVWIALLAAGAWHGLVLGKEDANAASWYFHGRQKWREVYLATGSQQKADDATRPDQGFTIYPADIGPKLEFLRQRQLNLFQPQPPY